jgi:hypothetical protein
MSLMLLLAASLVAAPPAAKPEPAPPTGHAARITVVGERVSPKVTSTFPAQSAKVAPGLLVLRVTYNTHMRADGWSYAQEAGAEYPDCAKSPRLLDDKESFVLICRTLPGKSYTVWFNRPPLNDFASLGRRPADPYELKFSTSDEEPVRTLAEAMKADPALSNASNPVEGDGLATYGQEEGPG